MILLPTSLVVLFAFVLGCILGSFLDVFTLRFHTGRSINGRSHCLSCGHTLSWYELFPIFSYAFLRGRCRVCHARIPVRLFLMEVITGAAFALVALVATSLVEMALGLVFVCLAIVITLYDIKHMIIPNALVIAFGAWATTRLGWEVWTQGEYAFLLSYVLSALMASLFYFSLWLVSKGRWIGLGDAKLALPLALVLTPAASFSFVILSFWVGAVMSMLLLISQKLIKRGQMYLRFFAVPLTIKSEVPFAPFLLIAFFLVYYFNIDVLSLFVLTL